MRSRRGLNSLIMRHLHMADEVLLSAESTSAKGAPEHDHRVRVPLRVLLERLLVITNELAVSAGELLLDVGLPKVLS